MGFAPSGPCSSDEVSAKQMTDLISFYEWERSFARFPVSPGEFLKGVFGACLLFTTGETATQSEMWGSRLDGRCFRSSVNGKDK